MTENSSSDLAQRFAQAQSDGKRLPERPDNATLLAIYGLFKQATAGDAHGERPGLTDLVARAKWDAWHARLGTTAEVAMQAYVDLIESLR